MLQARVAAGSLLVGGLVLVGVILLGLPLVLSPLSGVIVIAILLAVARDRLQQPAWRRLVVRITVLSGVAVVATLGYDLTRGVLASIDPSPYNPFEVVRVFGQLLLGTGAPPAATYAVGWAYHLFNGGCFGVAFGFLFLRDGRLPPRWAIARGVGWGLFLESFQLALYPGWIHVQWLAEFTTISLAGHLVYGSTLGFGGVAALRRLSAREAGR